jgi:hypothetical protein
MKSLIDIYPQPVLAKIGDTPLFVRQLTIYDLALLQDYLRRKKQHPLEGMREVLAVLDHEERKASLKLMWTEHQAFPIALGSLEGDEFLRSTEGIVFCLSLVLEEIELEEIVNLVTGRKPEEPKPKTDNRILRWLRVLWRGPDPDPLPKPEHESAPSSFADDFNTIMRAAWGTKPESEYLDMLRPLEGSDDPQPFAELVCIVAEKYGWTFEYIGSLSLSQFFSALHDGIKPSRLIPVSPEVALDPEKLAKFKESL